MRATFIRFGVALAGSALALLVCNPALPVAVLAGVPLAVGLTFAREPVQSVPVQRSQRRHP